MDDEVAGSLVTHVMVSTPTSVKDDTELMAGGTRSATAVAIRFVSVESK